MQAAEADATGGPESSEHKLRATGGSTSGLAGFLPGGHGPVQGCKPTAEES